MVVGAVLGDFIKSLSTNEKNCSLADSFQEPMT